MIDLIERTPWYWWAALGILLLNLAYQAHVQRKLQAFHRGWARGLGTLRNLLMEMTADPARPMPSPHYRPAARAAMRRAAAGTDASIEDLQAEEAALEAEWQGDYVRVMYDEMGTDDYEKELLLRTDLNPVSNLTDEEIWEIETRRDMGDQVFLDKDRKELALQHFRESRDKRG